MKYLNFKALAYSLMLFCVVVLTACPYSSEHPIDPVGVKIKRELMGKWTKNSGDNPPFYIFEKSDDNKYDVTKNEWSDTDKAYSTKTKYVGHISELGGTMFLNMFSDGKYYFYKLELSASELKLFEVTDNIDETFSSSAELKSFFMKHKDMSFFYNKDEEVYKK